MKTKVILGLMIALLSTGCVSKKKYKAQVASYNQLKESYDSLDNACSKEQTRLKDTISSLKKEIDALKASGNAMLTQLSDLSAITKEQAENVKKSLASLSAKDSYIKDLKDEMARKDSLNNVLVRHLKGALQDVNDSDVQVKVEGSAVFITISDKMLFKMNSYELDPQGKKVLSKVSEVLKSQPDMQLMVEGHTDNQPMKRTHFVKDNWDLSVLRATAVVRMLQKDFAIDPKRIIAAGRGETMPVAANDTDANRAANRRIRIMVIPQLDQFYKLVEKK